MGRNGEPQANAQIRVTVKHKDYPGRSEELTADKHGRVGLGPLDDVERVTARFSDFEETWTISGSHVDTWTQADDIHIIEGENIEIPVNYDDSKPLQRHQASLRMTREGTILKNMFDRIKLTKAQCGLYHLLHLEGLEVGEYCLNLRICAGQMQTFEITVHRGTYWEEKFILKKNCLFESSAQKNAIRLEEVNFQADPEVGSAGASDK